jgi:Flp pilus assembly protein protease CpaA
MTVTALAGGLLAVAVLVATRTWRTLAVRVIGLANGVGRDALPGPVHVPYGVAIAGGGLYVAAELALAVIHP